MEITSHHPTGPEPKSSSNQYTLVQSTLQVSLCSFHLPNDTHICIGEIKSTQKISIYLYTVYIFYVSILLMYTQTCFQHSAPPNKDIFLNIQWTTLHLSQFKLSRSQQTHVLCFYALLTSEFFCTAVINSIYILETHIIVVEKVAHFLVL